MRPSEPLPRSVILRSYAELTQWLNAFVTGLIHLTFLIGRPGLGKSQLALHTLERHPHGWIDCHATKLAIYCRLYECRDKPVVIDDENSLLTDPGKVTLMNALCQTNPRKTLRWDSTTRILEERGVPPVFETTSPVLVITNRLRDTSPPVRAMIDRGHPLLFQPTAADIHARVADWFTDREVYEFVGRWLPVIPGLSMRDYVKAKGMKMAGLDWQGLLHRQWKSHKLARVAALRADPTFPNEEARVAAFEWSRASYFRYVGRLKELGVGSAEELQSGDPVVNS